MTAGLLQLVAKGDQDEYLTGNPQITYYRYAFKRHTNFAMETAELQFSDLVNWGQMSTCLLSHKGDMLSNLYLQVRLPRLTNMAENRYAKWVQYVGLAMIKKIEITIGGQTFDSHPGEWLYIYNQLKLEQGKRNGYDYMVGFDIDPDEPKTLFIPLAFWFSQHTGLALPLVALSFHEVRLRIYFRPFRECVINAETEVPFDSVSILANYVYLDKIERMFFAKSEQEYIIEQLQYDVSNATNLLNPSIDITFVNPVKELIWIVQPASTNTIDYKDWFNFTYGNNKNPVKTTSLQINGIDRFTPLSGEYFNLIQPYQHHTNIPDNAGINMYSFALYPESPQPSGTLNFSRVDSAKLKLELMDDLFKSEKEAYIKIFGVTYNVMKIQSGMAGLKFAA